MKKSIPKNTPPKESTMKVIESNIIYENPLPQLRSRQSFFPCLGELSDGTLFAVVVIGEAFESVDSKSCITFSKDGGRTWSLPRPMFDFGEERERLTDYAKATVLPDGRVVAMGYTYLRDDPELPIGNPENGGVLDDFVFFSVSEDGGKTFGEVKKIACAWGPHVEASAPITLLPDGGWITPITGFPDWEGNMHGKLCGRALVSRDEGRSWSDDSVCMDFGAPVTAYEQRMCVLASGTIVNIGWNENVETGERLQNHYTLSRDGGKTWTAPRPTGILGQASSVTALDGERLLALHAVRRDTDRPGVYGCIVDLSRGEWSITEKIVLWEPSTPVTKDTKMAEIFSFLKFGQPSAILLSTGEFLMTHWYAEQGQYKTLATRIAL